MSYLLLLIGFIILIKGADIFVDSASSMARRFHIPSIVIGMTIVAIGTSAPEFSVSLTSALKGLNDMSIANVIGSNIFNLLVILGIASLFDNLKLNNFKDILITLGSSILLLISMINGVLGRFNGVMFLICFSLFIYDMIKKTKNYQEQEEVIDNKPLWKIILFGLLGLGAIIYGGNLVVNNASIIAMQLGMSEKLVGLTIVAVGTSLPEFVTSVVATKKGEVEIAIGNVLGSNIFNILLVLGLSSLISPMNAIASITDAIFMCIATTLFMLMTYKKRIITKTLGIPMLIIYIIYITQMII